MKEKTKRIKNWSDLVDFVESINPNKETLVLSGWINNLQFGHMYIKELVFTTKPVEILRDKNDKQNNKLGKKSVTKNKGK